MPTRTFGSREGFLASEATEHALSQARGQRGNRDACSSLSVSHTMRKEIARYALPSSRRSSPIVTLADDDMPGRAQSLME